MLESLDQYLATCSKMEAAKIDAITYSRITDMAVIYRIMAALQMHRPTPSVHYSSVEQVRKTHDYRWWRVRRHCNEMSKMLEDPRRFRFGSALSNLDKFRMPTGEKTQEWLDRADGAVSISHFTAVSSLAQRPTCAD